MKGFTITVDPTSASPYLLPYFVVALAFVLLRIFKLTWGVFIVAFIIIPIADSLIGLDTWNPSREQSKALEKKVSFQMVTWIWVPLQLFFIFWGAYLASRTPFNWFQYIGFASGIGIASGGLGITIAHELIHKPNIFEQILGKILLVSVCYGHFFIEHLWGHHKRVSTPYDPATSRFGESFYAFWPRTVIGSYLSAWHLESERLHKKGLSTFSIQNQMFHFAAASACFAFVCYAYFGLPGLKFFLFQSVVAFSLLELVNYIEHYGLERKKLTNDKFVQVTPMHSWNAAFMVSNYFLFKLQRHSDHHANAGKRYQVLRSFENSPQMPHGYPGMILMAAVPPLWFRVMDPLVMEYKRKAEEYERSGVDMFPEQ